MVNFRIDETTILLIEKTSDQESDQQSSIT